MNISDVKTTADYMAYCKQTAEYIVEVAIEQLKQEKHPHIDAEGIGDCIDGISVGNGLISEVISENGLDHEAIDGSAMVIYDHGHDIILQHTDNEDYGAENIGWDSMQADSWQGIKQNVAYWAFYGDVSDVLSDAITDKYDSSRKCHLCDCLEVNKWCVNTSCWEFVKHEAEVSEVIA